MPYKDPEKQKEAVRRAVERKRKGITGGITSREVNQGITEKGITDDGGITSDVNPEYPAIIVALSDIERRAKIRAVCDALCSKKVDLRKHVYYGYPGFGGVACDVVSELLEAFRD